MNASTIDPRHFNCGHSSSLKLTANKSPKKFNAAAPDEAGNHRKQAERSGGKAECISRSTDATQELLCDALANEKDQRAYPGESISPGIGTGICGGKGVVGITAAVVVLVG